MQHYAAFWRGGWSDQVADPGYLIKKTTSLFLSRDLTLKVCTCKSGGYILHLLEKHLVRAGFE